MTRSKTIIGALVLCALSICAFGAASASATGLTAVQCEEVPKTTGNYETNHCITPKAKEKNFETVAIPANTPKAVEGKDTVPTEHGKTGTTANPTAIFHSTVNGIETTVTCGKGSTTSGTLENLPGTTEMQIKTTGAKVVWTECHASPKTKPTKICTVTGIAPAGAVGEIKTNGLSSITKVETGAEHKVIITPEVEEAAEKTFTKFRINASGGECFTAANLEVKVTGQAWGRANTETHSHLTLDEASNAGGPLRANGAFASQTETVTGFTKGNEEATVGAETF